jgi:hypothetical protein
MFRTTWRVLLAQHPQTGDRMAENLFEANDTTRMEVCWPAVLAACGVHGVDMAALQARLKVQTLGKFGPSFSL